MSTGLSIERFSPDTAKALTTWRYPAPFDLYDSDPDDVDLYLRSEESGAGYWSVLNERRELIGFCCFGAEATVRGQDAIEGTVDVGGGVRPDVVSLGIASRFMPAVLGFGRRQFQPKRFRTTVASFNERSIRLCTSAGFIVTREFDGPDRLFTELILLEQPR
jgi:ribosomal-protein-alanine N-acetyltransferase